MCVWNVLTRRNVRMGTVPKKGTGFLHETEHINFAAIEDQRMQLELDIYTLLTDIVIKLTHNHSQ